MIKNCGTTFASKQAERLENCAVTGAGVSLFSQSKSPLVSIFTTTSRIVNKIFTKYCGLSLTTVHSLPYNTIQPLESDSDKQLGSQVSPYQLVRGVFAFGFTNESTFPACDKEAWNIECRDWGL
ncbi:MAG TPA: hypothetical protein VMX35_11985 [Acidobacteriota bacterium]|nr:hypothetical protein [Acidobacteriota bacterium]